MNQELFSKSLWLDLIRDILPDATYIELRFSQLTLRELVEQALEVSDYILYGSEVDPGNAFMEVVHAGIPVRNQLQVLRFLKRYTPKEAIGDFQPFLDVNKKVRDFRSESSYIRYCVCESLRNLLRSYTYDSHGCTLPTGAAYEKEAKTMVDKLRVYEKYDPLYLYPLVGNTVQTEPAPKANRAAMVPKTIFKPRYICLEPVARSVQAGGVEAGIYKCLPPWCNYQEQERNRALAMQGSLDNSLATIDLSAASDTVSWQLIQDSLYDTELLADLSRCRATRTLVPNPEFGSIQYSDEWDGERWVRRYKLDNRRTIRMVPAMLSSMGNRITYPMECAVFIACIDVANHFCGVDTPVRDLPVNMYGCVGDDLIVPADIAQALILVLTSVGFTVNEEKSFYGIEYFRESCGGEYYHGIDISTVYWPRQYVPMSTEGLPSLISLQHKLVNYPRANRRLVQQIRELYPKITESSIGSDYTDIWARYPRIQYGQSPYKWGAPNEELGWKDGEYHTTFLSKYGDLSVADTADSARLAYSQFLEVGPPVSVDRSGFEYHRPTDLRLYGSSPTRIVRNKYYL